MPQISITNALAKETLKRAFTSYDYPGYTDGNGAYTLGYGYGLNGGNWTNISAVEMRLMKGTVPTDFSGIPNLYSRASDTLVTWSGSPNAELWQDTSDTSISLISTPLVYASLSGTATWLWWYSYNSYSPSTTLQYSVVFTVGTLGSGSDFEMPTTDIVSGRGYKLINGPRLTMATEFNY
jgi:hypothetical protein